MIENARSQKYLLVNLQIQTLALYSKHRILLLFEFPFELMNFLVKGRAKLRLTASLRSQRH